MALLRLSTNRFLNVTFDNLHTLFITFNRPEKRNCLNFEAIDTLKRLLVEIDQTDRVRKVVFRGAGGHFCSGLDLNELKAENKHKLADLYGDDGRWFASRKMLIAFVQGYAVGLGFEFALACDVVIGDQTSKFGFLNRRFGLPTVLPLHRYRNLVGGRLKAIDLIDLPQIIRSTEASKLGLISHLIEDESSLPSKLDEIEANTEDLERTRSIMNTSLRIDKLGALPDAWVNHELDPTTYNWKRRKHGKFDTFTWNELISRKEKNQDVDTFY